MGVGMNDANYTLTHKKDGKRHCCPYYARWYHILRRCYDKKFHNYNPGVTYATTLLLYKIELGSDIHSENVDAFHRQSHATLNKFLGCFYVK